MAKQHRSTRCISSATTMTTTRGGYYASYYWWWLFMCWVCVGGAAARDCDGPDVGVVVVASVFGTLAVVALVLVIVFLLLRRRNKGALFPKRGRSGGGVEEGHTNNDNSYVNAAFSVHDVSDGEQGKKRSSPQKSHSPGKKLLKTDSQKTWVSLPGSQEQFPGLFNRQGSCGSLDTNYTNTETVSVQLRSQDIIGLGFNISGNMRDGIYVSQVHSRGPAIESGKIHVGDRILGVTIGYENMVYEDALTILSYASPYPVRLTLQKERAAHPDLRLAPGGSQRLHHPLYRSQSLEALMHIGREPRARPKRTLSESKSDTRAKAERSQRTKESISQSYPGCEAGGRGDWQGANLDVLVHREPRLQSQFSTVDSLPSDHGPWSTEDGPFSIEDHDHALGTEPVHNLAADSAQDEAGAQAGRKKSRLDMEAAREFANLMDQVQDGPGRTAATVSPKTAPNKPERKKKPSSSSTVSSDDSAEALAEVVGVDETFQSRHTAEVEVGVENIQRSPVEDGFTNISLSDHGPTDSPERDGKGQELVEAAVTSRHVQAGVPLNSSKGRDKSRDRESGEKEKKKPVLSNEEVERLIAMNSFLPGTQGLAGIQAGGKQGGIHDDFVPRDLLHPAAVTHIRAVHSAGSITSSDTSSQSHQRQRERQRGGVAFEVREDALTGRPMSVDISRSRTSSASPSRSGSRDRMPRASSMIDNSAADPKQRQAEDKENREDGLGWSGQRLVRSDSFSQIPLGDSLHDWADHKLKAAQDDDDDHSTASGKPSTADTNPDSDAELDAGSRPLSSRDVFRARENLANMSDLSNSMSSSRSSSPPVANGPADSVTLPAPSSSIPSSGNVTGFKNVSTDLLAPSGDPNGNSKGVSVRVRATSQEDMEC